MLKIVFFGTPDYVLPILERLSKEFRVKNESPIVAVVTQKPMPVGRKQLLEYSPIDKWAHERNIPVYYDVNKLIEDGIKAEIGVLAAYGAILPENIIEYFPKGIINIHPSLLPKYRGASPIQGQIINGETETGVTIIKLDKQMDHGGILAQFTEDVLPLDTTDTLRTRLFEKSVEVVSEVMKPYMSGKITLKEQKHEDATYTRLIKKEFGLIPAKYIPDLMSGKEIGEDWNIEIVKDLVVKPTPQIVEKLSRALFPWPGIWTKFTNKGKERRLKLLEIKVVDNKLEINKVQIEGKNPVSWSEFKNGYPEAQF
jgi:methionyl-tRNA formyltransferase